MASDLMQKAVDESPLHMRMHGACTVPLNRSAVVGKAPAGRACDGWVDSWRGRLDVPAECTSERDPRPGGSEGRLISGTGIRMGAEARLVACSGKSTRPVLAARMSSRALLLACPCPA